MDEQEQEHEQEQEQEHRKEQKEEQGQGQGQEFFEGDTHAAVQPGGASRGGCGWPCHARP